MFLFEAKSSVSWLMRQTIDDAKVNKQATQANQLANKIFLVVAELTGQSTDLACSVS